MIQILSLIKSNFICVSNTNSHKMKKLSQYLDTFLSAAEGAEDSVAKFTSLVRARD